MSQQASGFGGMGFGGGPFGGPLVSASLAIAGAVKCAPVLPGSFSLYHSLATLTDDGNGNLVGDGSGTIDYRTGEFTASMNPGVSGTPIQVNYTPQEGGCCPDCGSCKTSCFRLIITPGTNIDQNQISVTDAFSRLVQKIAEITPIMATWCPLVVSDNFNLQFTTLFDLTPADVIPLDSTGYRVVFA